jgi:thioredoxin-related protein
MEFLTKEEDIRWSSGINSFYFYSTTMPFHKKMIKMVSQVENKFKLSFLAIDTDYFITTPIRFNLDSVPVIIIYQNSKEIYRINGMVDTQNFIEIYSTIIKKGNENDSIRKKRTTKKRINRIR